jgi:hypothetical protein
MKQGIGLAIILVVALGIGFLLSKNRTPSSAPTQASQAAAVAAALASQSTNTVAVIQSNFARVQPVAPSPSSTTSAINPPGQPAPLQFTNFDATIVLENMGRAVHQYGTMFGGNPVGDNQEITSQLNGNNPKHIHFINSEAGMRLNENGELIDAWGTPYFFHQLSGNDTEIHSAGPDRILWTSDDLVSH